MRIAECKQLLPLAERHHRATRVAGRADIDQLRARPNLCRDGRPVGREIPRWVAIGKGELCASQQGRALVDLVERVGRDDGRAGL